MSYILYDNNCPFCKKIIEIISNLIDEKKLKITPIESKIGKKIVAENSLENANSIIYVSDSAKTYLKSKAVLKICSLMKFPYNLMYIFNIFPKSILDYCYDFIARNRMKIKI